jgi:predicted TIM-barrel fold metal-dependent hydrolase
MYIFDSLTHISLGKNILWNYGEANLNHLLKEMENSLVKRAIVCHIEPLEPGSRKNFAELISNSDHLFTFGTIKCSSSNEIRNEIKELKENGYIGIKVHPRFQELPWHGDWFVNILTEAASQDMVVAYCTYCFNRLDKVIGDPELLLFNSIAKVPESKIILMHGGGIDLLRYSEIVRHSNNLLLDISFTMCKYAGSSLDLDIEFLFQNFDRKICVGSDYPDFSPNELTTRFHRFSLGIDDDKVKRIAHLNLENFLNIDTMTF